MEKVEVETSLGKFEMIKPKAGMRNKALLKAEGSDGSIKRVLFMTELIPKMISRRPENCDPDVPIEHLLNDLSIEDYDKLVETVDVLVGEQSVEGEDKKKE